MVGENKRQLIGRNCEIASTKDIKICTRYIQCKLSFLVSLACFLWPFWRFRPLEFNGDASFLWFLHEAFHRGTNYGSEIVITAGPWSILNYSVFHPETYIVVLSMQTAFSVLLTVALIKSINHTPFNTFLRFFLVLGMVTALSLSPDARSLVYLSLLPIVYETLEKRRVSLFFTFVAFSTFVALSKRLLHDCAFSNWLNANGLRIAVKKGLLVLQCY